MAKPSEEPPNIILNYKILAFELETVQFFDE